MEDSAKAYAKQRWKASSHRKRGRGRGRGRPDAGGRRPFDEESEGPRIDGTRAYDEADEDSTAVKDGAPVSVSTGADLSELLQDCHLQQVQAQYRHRGYITLQDDELDASAYHGKDLELDLQRLAACLASVPLHELLRMEPEALGSEARPAAAPTPHSQPAPHPFTLPTSASASPHPHQAAHQSPPAYPQPSPSLPSRPASEPQHAATNSHAPPAPKASGPVQWTAPSRPAAAAEHPGGHPAVLPPEPDDQDTSLDQPDDQDTSLDQLLSLTAPPQPQQQQRQSSATSVSPAHLHSPSRSQPGQQLSQAQPGRVGGPGAAQAQPGRPPTAAPTPASKTSVLDDLDDLLAELPAPRLGSQAPSVRAAAGATGGRPTLPSCSSASTSNPTAPASSTTATSTTSRQQLASVPGAATAAPSRQPSSSSAAAPSGRTSALPASQPKQTSSAVMSLDDWLDNL